MADQKPGRKRGVWRWLMLGSVLTSLLLLGGVYLAATCRPSWYQPIAVDQSRLREDKREFVGLLDRIGHALNRGESIVLTFDEAQLNRWIVARDELWPGTSLQIAGIEQPFLSLLSGSRLRLAVTATATAVPAVISLTVSVSVERDLVLLEVDGVQAGRLPVPSEQLLAQIGDMLPPERAALRDGVIRVGNSWIWENGQQPFRIASLTVMPGQAEVVLEPLR
jgi:hypothetical protein